jgi:hypothetical protein
MNKFLGKKNKNYKQGIFTPKNKDKYKGTLPIIYRSGLELKAFRYLDNNSNVISWGSESVIIPYVSPLDGKIHRYFVDLVAKLNSKDGTIKNLLIEVKPEKQTRPPLESQNKKKKTLIYEKYQFATNMAKWDAARAWCKSKGYIFIILNEKHLKE